MTIELAIAATVRDVVREEIRAALAESQGGTGDQYMTYSDAAKFTSCCVTTIVSWIHDGSLPSYGRGRARRVLRSEVVRAMQCQPKEVGVEVSPADRAAEILAGVKLKRGR